MKHLNLHFASAEQSLNTAPHVCDDPFCVDHAPTLFWVALYEVSREFGGPGEGGWWYNFGELILDPAQYTQGLKPQCFEHVCEARAAFARLHELAAKLNGDRRSYQPQYCAEIHEGRLPEFYPAEQPRYE